MSEKEKEERERERAGRERKRSRNYVTLLILFTLCYADVIRNVRYLSAFDYYHYYDHH